jgi:hypothetical protein
VSKAVKHLKSSLRPFYKKACKDVMSRKSQIARLQEMAPAI